MRTYLLLLSMLLSYCSFAQNITWSAPVSVAASSYDNMHPRIALDGSNDPVVVWGSGAMGGQAVFARWSGSSFAAPIVLNPMSLPVSTFSWAGPGIAAHGDTIYAVMKTEPEDTGRMYILRSFDGGQNWSSPIAINSITDTSRFPTVTTDATGNPMVGYMQFGLNFSEARYVFTRSNDYGNSFIPSVRASNQEGEACDCCPASLIRANNTVVMLYRNNLSNIRTIWARVSNDGGNTFDDSIEVDNTNWMAMSCPSSGPDGVIIGDTLYTVFRSSVSGSRFYLSKASISTPQLVTASQYAANFTGLSQQDFPRIANAGNAIAMVWKQVVGGSSKLCVSFTNDVTGGISPVYDTLAQAGVINGDVVIVPGAIHVVWEDVVSGTVMYRKGTYVPASVAETSKEGVTIEVYPNPAKDQFAISTRDVKKVSNCVLIDNSGKRIGLEPVHTVNSVLFSLEGVVSGLYIVQVIDNTGNIYSSKLIVK